MKKLFLIFHGRFPSEKAASLFTAKNAEAFSRQGFDVTVLVPKRKNIPTEDAFAFYGISQSFKIVYVPMVDIFDTFLLKYIAFVASMFSFSWSIFYFLKKNYTEGDIVYSNEIVPLFFVSKIVPNCFYEMHDFPESKLFFFGHALGLMRWVLVHNKWKLKRVYELFPRLRKDLFLYEPNAVDVRDFDVSISTAQARKDLGLSPDKKIIVYTGHLYGWKGVDTLAEAARLLPLDFEVIFVGGTSHDVDSFLKRYGDMKNIQVVGHKPHAQIPLWQKAADVLVLPNTGKEKISLYYTSPMKLFEYMASKKPIVASDIPSIREIIGEDSAVFFKPDDAVSLAEAIRSCVDGDRSHLVEKAFLLAQKHTWYKRAERIVRFMKQK